MKDRQQNLGRIDAASLAAYIEKSRENGPASELDSLPQIPGETLRPYGHELIEGVAVESARMPKAERTLSNRERDGLKKTAKEHVWDPLARTVPELKIGTNGSGINHGPRRKYRPYLGS